MAKSIAAIPTTFNGIIYRSRLEARYAVFFQKLGIPYEYEPEGFYVPTKCGNKAYLPDFLILGDCYIEIKPSSFDPDASDNLDYIEMLKSFAFQLHHKGHIGLFIGPPAPKPFIIFERWDDEILKREYSFNKQRLWIDPCYDQDWVGDCASMVIPSEMANSAKFEHGKNGTP